MVGWSISNILFNSLYIFFFRSLSMAALGCHILFALLWITWHYYNTCYILIQSCHQAAAHSSLLPFYHSSKAEAEKLPKVTQWVL